MKKLLLIGGGGHCKSIIDSLISGRNDFDQIGIIDTKEKVGTDISGIKIIGSDSELEELYDEGYRYAFISLGSVGNPDKRMKCYDYLRGIGYELPNIIDKDSIIAKEVKLECGIYVAKRVAINAGTQISECAIINTGAVVEHDCKIGKFVHIAPGSVVCGNVSVGDYSHIGANSTIIQGIKIGDRALIGAGSTIIREVSMGITVVGVPGRRI